MCGALSPRNYLEARRVPSSGTMPSQNGTCLGDGIGSKIRTREKYRHLFSVREEQRFCAPVSHHQVKHCFLGGEKGSKHAYRGAFYKLLDRSCMCAIGLTKDLEVRVLKRMFRATRRERRRIPRKSGDGACRDIVSGAEGVEGNGSDKKPRCYGMF